MDYCGYIIIRAIRVGGCLLSVIIYFSIFLKIKQVNFLINSTIFQFYKNSILSINTTEIIKCNQKKSQIMTITILLIIFNEIFCFVIPDLILIFYKDLTIFFLINLNKGLN